MTVYTSVTQTDATRSPGPLPAGARPAGQVEGVPTPGGASDGGMDGRLEESPAGRAGLSPSRPLPAQHPGAHLPAPARSWPAENPQVSVCQSLQGLLLRLQARGG